MWVCEGEGVSITVYYIRQGSAWLTAQLNCVFVLLQCYVFIPNVCCCCCCCSQAEPDSRDHLHLLPHGLCSHQLCLFRSLRCPVTRSDNYSTRSSGSRLPIMYIHVSSLPITIYHSVANFSTHMESL